MVARLAVIFILLKIIKNGFMCLLAVRNRLTMPALYVRHLYFLIIITIELTKTYALQSHNLGCVSIKSTLICKHHPNGIG